MDFIKNIYSENKPTPRPEVQKLSAYKAPLEGRRNLIRLDFNENTIGPSPKVLQALHEIPNSHIAIYPEYQGLKEAFINNLKAYKLKNPPKQSQVGIFNGVDAAIHAIFHSYGDRGEKVITTAPTFGYYAPCAHMQGMEVISIPYQEETFEFPLEQILQSLQKKNPKLLLICNPNNPTGTRLPAQEIINLAQASPKTLVVVDELYEAFTGDSALPLIDFSKIRNILILRSLSKTAGLAGLRIGFAISNDEVIDNISRVIGPYDVNTFAVKAAFAALEDQEYIDKYVEEVKQAKQWIKNKLILNEVNHHIDGGNYFLIWPRQGANKTESILKLNGILTRNMSGKILLNDCLRVSIGTKSQMESFWEIFIKEEKS